MAATDSMPVCKKGVAFRHLFWLLDADGAAVTGATGLDSEISKDGGAFADCTNEAQEIGQGAYYLDLTTTETNCDGFHLIVKTSSSGAIPERAVIAPQETGDIPVTVTGMANNIITASVIANDAISSDQLASDAVAEIADAVWDEDITTHVTANSAGEVQNLVTPFYQAVIPSLTTITNRIGGFTGTGVNTILGFFKALMSKAASTPSDVGGTYSAATDATEALRDNVGTAVNATISADIAAVKGETASILADTATLPASPAATGDIPSAATIASQVRTELSTELGRIDTPITTARDAVLAKLPAALVGGRIDASVGAMANDVISAAAMSAGAAAEIGAAVTLPQIDGLDFDDAIAAILAVLLGKRSVSDVTITCKGRDGTTTLATLTMGATPGEITASVLAAE